MIGPARGFSTSGAFTWKQCYCCWHVFCFICLICFCWFHVNCWEGKAHQNLSNLPNRDNGLSIFPSCPVDSPLSSTNQKGCRFVPMATGHLSFSSVSLAWLLVAEKQEASMTSIVKHRPGLSTKVSQKSYCHLVRQRFTSCLKQC